MRFETAVHAIEGELSGENGFVVIRFEEKSANDPFGDILLSSQQAFLNLSRELDQTTADYLSNAQQSWENYLNRIDIKHHDPKQVSTFYHNFYRLFYSHRLL